MDHEERAGTDHGDGDELLVEPFGGMAGDMFLAALLDLGDPRFTIGDLESYVAAVVPGEARIGERRVWRGSLAGTHLDVVTPERTSAPSRGLADLLVMVDAAPLSDDAKSFAGRVLRSIAEAEGRVHDCDPGEVHFHEIGAVDTIFDVGGAALALDRLGIARARVTPPLVGSGTIECAHGTMPVPAPATAEILRGLPTVSGGAGERLTPTGAAILVELARLGRGGDEPLFSSGHGEAWTALRHGYGAGTRNPDVGPPNLVRVQLGTRANGAPSAQVDELRVNLDDMSPEEIGDVVQGLRDAGALEVWTSSISMKKDRPGVVVTALVRSADRDALLRVLFERSSTFGVRWSPMERIECVRRFETIEVEGVAVRVKVRVRPTYEGRSDDGARDVYCEHDDLVRLARVLGLPLREARTRVFEARSASGA
ncbi:MAG: nickel pincer cofactor biosynthesis protein LarC [Planctomycetota bacterium]